MNHGIATVKIRKQSAMFLSVKRIVVEQVGAVELLAVGLVHGDHVFLPFEYLNLKCNIGPLVKLFRIVLCYNDHLVCHLRPAPDKVSLPGDGDQGPCVQTCERCLTKPQLFTHMAVGESRSF